MRDTVSTRVRGTKAVALGLAAALVGAAALVAFAGTAVAHRCVSRGPEDASGCNAHLCPTTEHHIHVHDETNASQADHYCFTDIEGFNGQGSFGPGQDVDVGSGTCVGCAEGLP